MSLDALAPARCDALNLDDEPTYRRWRDWKLHHAPHRAEDLLVEIADPARLHPAERSALLTHVHRCGMAFYRLRPGADGSASVEAMAPAQVQALGAQLGLRRLDANWLADEDGLSRITAHAGPNARPEAGPAGDAGAFIPYTHRAIRWHTDGYYHPEDRRIRGMMLHCVQPAPQGGGNQLLDHELAYIALRDANPAYIRALLHPQAMTIPERRDDAGVARPAQSGPVFSVENGHLHMRYTARTRSIAWRDDVATQAAAAALLALLEDPHTPGRLSLKMQAGMGLVCHNVLHDRSAFEDDASAPRLLLRARYLDRCSPLAEAPWRNG